MKNLFNQRTAALIIALALIAGTVPNASYAADEGCVQWQLVWTNPPVEVPTETAGTPVPSTFYPGENPVRAATAPAVPTNLPAGSDAKWQCIDNPLDSARTEEEKKAPPGMELCAQAAKLAAKFGGFAALNVFEKIQTSVLNNVKDYLAKELKGRANITIDFNDIKRSVVDAAGKYTGIDLNNLFDSSGLKKEVNDKLKKIEKEAKEGLLAAGGEAAKKAVDAAKGIVSTDVPVKDIESIAQQKAIEKKIDQQIAEQKIAEVNADTRQKCKELLVTTNETIKKTILYQLSTQIVDWIQTGEKPQFIRQPGKFLEDTGRLAVDRFISRVAPRLCEPFRLSVQLQIPTVQRQENPFYEQITCTLDQVVSNVENFYQDFSQGGWVAYNEILKPQNSYYFTSLALLDEAARQQTAAVETARREQERGFVPVKECTSWTKYVPVTASAGGIFDRVNVEGLGDFTAADVPTPEAPPGRGPMDKDGDVVAGFRKDPQTGPVQKGTRFWKKDVPPNDIYFWECRADEITSPATIAAGLAERASQTDLDNLAASQDVSLFLQTIEDSIVNKLVKSGVKGLQRLLP